MKFYKHFIIAALSLCSASYAFAGSSQEIGSVDTEFKMVGANHKIVIEVFDDPLVNGVSCYVSRAKTGGWKGTIGLAEDPSEASVACRQVGPISFNGKIPQQAEVFNQSASPLFKKIRIVRIVDPKRQTLVYLQYSDKIVEGSPKNSITAVPVDKPIPVK
jgi:CreA protein